MEAGSSAASEAAERSAVDYLVQHVLTSRPERHLVKDAILPKPSAKNGTVAVFRSFLSQYLSSNEFKKRWDALKAQVSSFLRVCA